MILQYSRMDSPIALEVISPKRTGAGSLGKDRKAPATIASVILTAGGAGREGIDGRGPVDACVESPPG